MHLAFELLYVYAFEACATPINFGKIQSLGERTAGCLRLEHEAAPNQVRRLLERALPVKVSQLRRPVTGR